MDSEQQSQEQAVEQSQEQIVEQPQEQQPDDSEPSPERLADLRAVYEANVAAGKPPYAGVVIPTRGEVNWIVAERGWRTGGFDSFEQTIDFRSAGFRSAVLSHVDFTYANLSSAVIVNSPFNNADLTLANLSGAVIVNSPFSSANLTNANLSDTRINESAFDAASFSHANLSGAVITESPFNNADLTNANLSGVMITKSPFNNADFSLANLSDMFITESPFNEADLSFADLSGVFINRGIFNNANFTMADLSGARIGDSTFNDADFTGAKVCGAILVADFSGVDMTQVRMDSATMLGGADNANDAFQLNAQSRLLDVAWNGAILANVRWDQLPRLGDEAAIKAATSRTERVQALRGTARAYRGLAKSLQAQGLTIPALRYRAREQQLERRALLYSFSIGPWLFSWLLNLVSGYGDKPGRALACYLAVIGVFTGTYWAITNQVFGFISSNSTHLAWYEALVLSISSFHGRGFFPSTLSLGDPIAIVASAEAIIGLFIELVFIATFTQRFFAR